MCQNGAEIQAENGRKYGDILKYYYFMADITPLADVVGNNASVSHINGFK